MAAPAVCFALPLVCWDPYPTSRVMLLSFLLHVMAYLFLGWWFGHCVGSGGSTAGPAPPQAPVSAEPVGVGGADVNG